MPQKTLLTEDNKALKVELLSIKEENKTLRNEILLVKHKIQRAMGPKILCRFIVLHMTMESEGKREW